MWISHISPAIHSGFVLLNSYRPFVDNHDNVSCHSFELFVKTPPAIAATRVGDGDLESRPDIVLRVRDD